MMESEGQAGRLSSCGGESTIALVGGLVAIKRKGWIG